MNGFGKPENSLLCSLNGMNVMFECSFHSSSLNAVSSSVRSCDQVSSGHQLYDDLD